MTSTKQFLSLLVITSTLFITACGGSSNGSDDSANENNENTVNELQIENLNDSAANELSIAEIDGLLFMREEEELARDLYLDIYENKNNSLTVFKNISDNAEMQHAEAIRLLLEKYLIEDPSTGQRNSYNDTELQALYNNLFALASNGDTLAALKVGALVEETDTRDINAHKDLVSTEHLDIISTYDNLLCGSRNHLRAFAKQIESLTGMSYETQVPELNTEVQAILASEQEQCSN